MGFGDQEGAGEDLGAGGTGLFRSLRGLVWLVWDPNPKSNW